MKEEKVVSLRMNPEPKRTGRNKMILIVKGFMEPPEWDGKTDSPTAMSSTVRQPIAMGRAEVIDGDLYMEADDVLSIGDISIIYQQHSCLVRNMDQMTYPGM